VIADEKKRVVLPSARPGDQFEVRESGETFVLRRLHPARARPAKVKVERRGGFSVGVLDRPIDEEALKEALAEFP
jgi:hypothetical protein